MARNRIASLTSVGSWGLEHLGGSPCPAPVRRGPGIEGGGERPRLAAGSRPRLFCTLQCCPSDVGSLPSAWFLRGSGGSTSSLRLGSCRAERTRWGEQPAAGARDASPSLGCLLSAPARRAGPRPAGSRSSEGRSLASCCRIRPPPRPGEGQPRSEVRLGRVTQRLLSPARGAGSAAGPWDGGREGGGEDGSRILGSSPGGWATEAG